MTHDDSPHLTANQKAQLLNVQFARALAGDPVMLKHLGETELNQIKTERVVSQHELMLPDMTNEQLLELITDHAVTDENPETVIDHPEGDPLVVAGDGLDHPTIQNRFFDFVNRISKTPFGELDVVARSGTVATQISSEQELQLKEQLQNTPTTPILTANTTPTLEPANSSPFSLLADWNALDQALDADEPASNAAEEEITKTPTR